MWVRFIIVTQFIFVAFSGYPSFGLLSTRSEHPQNGSGTDTSTEVYIVWPKSTQQQLSDDLRRIPATRFPWKSCNNHSSQGNDNTNCPSLADFLNHFCADQNETQSIYLNAKKHVQRNILLRLQPGEHALGVGKRFFCYDNLTIEGSIAASTVISATGMGVGRKHFPYYGVITFVQCGKVLIKDLTFQLGSTKFYNCKHFIFDLGCRKFELLRCVFINQNPKMGSMNVDLDRLADVSSSVTISDCQFHRLADRPFSLYGHNEPSLSVNLGSTFKRPFVSHTSTITRSAFVVRFSASACMNTTSEERHRQM